MSLLPDNWWFPWVYSGLCNLQWLHSAMPRTTEQSFICKLVLQVDFAFFSFLFFPFLSFPFLFFSFNSTSCMLSNTNNLHFNFKMDLRLAISLQVLLLFFYFNALCTMTFKTISSHELGYNRFSIRQKAEVICPLQEGALPHLSWWRPFWWQVSMPTNSVLREVWSLRFRDSIRAGIQKRSLSGSWV